MATPAQQYVNSFFNQGRLSSGSGGLSNDQGLEGGLNRTATAGALGATAVFPAVVNNMSYADDYRNLTKSVGEVGRVGGIYSNYKTALGLADYDSAGSDQFSNTFSPGNMFRTGVQTASYMNPVTGILNAVNSLTRNDDTPQGTIPGVNFVQGKVDAMADAMNNSQLGTAISRGARNIYNKTIAPVVQSKPGKLLTSTAGLPMGLAESGYSTLREGYQALDRGLFGGYLPFGARDDDPETQKFDNPLNPLAQSYSRFKNSILGITEKENSDIGMALTAEGQAMWDSRGQFEKIPSGDLKPELRSKIYEQNIDWKDLSPLDQQEWIKNNSNTGTANNSFDFGDEFNGNQTAKLKGLTALDALATRAEELGYDMDAKGNITKKPLSSPNASNAPESKWNNTSASYTPFKDPDGEVKIMNWVTETRPDQIDIDLEYKNVDGYETYYKAGTNVAYEDTREFAEYLTQMDDLTFQEYLVFGVDADAVLDGYYDYYESRNMNKDTLRQLYQNQVGGLFMRFPFDLRNDMKQALEGTSGQDDYLAKRTWGTDVNYKLQNMNRPGANAIFRGARQLAESGVMGTYYTPDGRKIPLENTRDQAINKQVSDHVLNSATMTGDASQYFQDQMNQMDYSFYQTDYNMSNPIDNYISNVETGPLQDASYNLPNNYNSIRYEQADF